MSQHRKLPWVKNLEDRVAKIVHETNARVEENIRIYTEQNAQLLIPKEDFNEPFFREVCRLIGLDFIIEDDKEYCWLLRVRYTKDNNTKGERETRQIATFLHQAYKSKMKNGGLDLYALYQSAKEAKGVEIVKVEFYKEEEDSIKTYRITVRYDTPDALYFFGVRHTMYLYGLIRHDITEPPYNVLHLE